MSPDKNGNPSPDSGPPSRRVKIIATIGPGCRTPGKIAKLIEAGADIFRLHSSYAGQEEHFENIQMIRNASEAVGQPVELLQDLSGTKARMNAFRDDQVSLEKGGRFRIGEEVGAGNATQTGINHPELLEVIEKGDTVLLNDGALELKVIESTKGSVDCEVLRGGTIKSGQAIHVPGKSVPLPVPTSKDRSDIAFALENGVEWIALSYASRAEEFRELRSIIENHEQQADIVAKIERRSALDQLDAILTHSDAVMVARGDLGLELPIEQIGVVQKEIIRRSSQADQWVITATEMLSSMMEQPNPTRAEVTDITNAVLDGSDALMLSGETAIGKYPVESVKMMDRIIRAAEGLEMELRTNR